MATGTYLAELQAALLDQKATLDAALVSAGQTALRSLSAEPPSKDDRRPLAAVTLAGPRGADRPFGGTAEIERVPVTVRLEIDGTEATALAYEGVVKVTLDGLGATLAAAVTDAELAYWKLTGGSLARDTDRRNADAWRAEIRFEATVQW